MSHTNFHLVHCIFSEVIVCHFLCSLMAFDCQEIKGLLTYLLTCMKPERYGQVMEEAWSNIHNTGCQLTADSIMTVKQR